MPIGSPENPAILEPLARTEPRDVEQVPFVELADDRLQGVVSSGSDPARAYCCYIEAGSLAYYSSTKNNRPDAGTAKRMRWLAEAAFAQFGRERVVRYLRLPVPAEGIETPGDLIDVVARNGSLRLEPSGSIFSRFLGYLRYVELSAEPGPVPGMSCFVGA